VTDRFSSKRIRLRAFHAADASDLVGYLNHPDLEGRRYIPWKYPHTLPLSTTHVEGILSQWSEAEKGLTLAVCLLPESVLIGHLCLDWGWDAHSPSIALVIAPEHHRLGYGSEALQLGLKYLFEETPAHNVSADWVADWNIPAQAFLQKHSFQKAGRARWAGLRHQQPYDMIAWDILRTEWCAIQEQA
jgi:RimJ/RimL family protein N-acetyltransferase